MSNTDLDKSPAQLIAELEALRSELATVKQSNELLLNPSNSKNPTNWTSDQTQERLKYLLTASPAIIYSCRPDGDYGATFISENVTTHFGYQPQDFIEDAGFWINHVHPEDTPKILGELTQLFEKNHHTHEYRFLHQDGTYRWVQDDLTLIRDAAGNPLEIVGSWLNITERKQAETSLKQQLDAQKLAVEMIQRIRKSLNPFNILNTTVAEVRQFLQSDRVVIFRFDPDWSGKIIVESVGEDWMPILGKTIYDPCFANHYVSPFRNGQITAKADIHAAGISECHIELLVGLQVRANLVVPIFQEENLWGLLVVHHCQAPRPWQPTEIDLLRQIAAQVGIAIQQSQLVEQLQVELLERKQAEEALQQSEERWRLAIAGTKDMVFDQNLVTQEVFLSEQCREILGYSEAEMNSLETWLNYVHPEDVEGFRQSFLDHLQGKIPRFSYEYRMQCQDGSYKWLLGRGQAVWDESSNPMRVVGFVTDITSRKQIEAEIRTLNAELEQRVLERTAQLNASNAQLTAEMEERQQAQIALQAHAQEIFDLYNNAPCGYQSLDAEGTIIRINDTQLDWLGYTREEILGRKKFSELISSESKHIFTQNFPIFKERGWVNNLEFELCRKDGSILPINLNSAAVKDADGNFVMSRSTLFDISDRKRVENALRSAEQRWRSFLEKVNLVVIGLDKNGIVEFANPFYFEITGYTAAEVYGKDWFSIFLADQDKSVTFEAFEDLLENDFYPYFQNTILTKAGEPRLINWNNALLRNPQGQVIGTMSIGQDVTEREALERMKDEFISVVSHELRTPLTSIRGSLGLLDTGILNNNPEQMSRMIKIAATDTERLVRLVNDILDLERLKSGKITLLPEQCDVATLIRRSLEVMQASAQEAEVTLEMTPCTIQVWGDPDRIIQTFTNLLSNAIKFSPPGGTVQLIAEPSTSSHALFQVKDQGRGIPEDKLETIFGRFQQVDASDMRMKGGTGLGLAICQTIVAQHGGHIWAESTLGEGSTFKFTLPTSSETSAKIL